MLRRPEVEPAHQPCLKFACHIEVLSGSDDVGEPGHEAIPRALADAVDSRRVGTLGQPSLCQRGDPAGRSDRRRFSRDRSLAVIHGAELLLSRSAAAHAIDWDMRPRCRARRRRSAAHGLSRRRSPGDPAVEPREAVRTERVLEHAWA